MICDKAVPNRGRKTYPKPSFYPWHIPYPSKKRYPKIFLNFFFGQGISSEKQASFSDGTNVAKISEASLFYSLHTSLLSGQS
jgi:hypothetical protein